MEDTILGLGSNLGDREGNLRKAMSLLRSSREMAISKISSVYLTSPVDCAGGDFYNACVRGVTSLSPEDLLAFGKKIEKMLGRQGSGHDPRPIDIDILFYGSLVVAKEGLVIPHPSWSQRLFVIMPLLDVCDNFIEPVSGELLCVIASMALKIVKQQQGKTRCERLGRYL
jgi:2-amino-4-hydroxy-6-hydroxymethyldihydropteridine diphosphokinase